MTDEPEMTDEELREKAKRELAAAAIVEFRKHGRPPKAEKEPEPEIESDEFYGITPRECCAKCRPNQCVITGVGICAHPYKNGLQGALTAKPDVVDRFMNAKKYLSHQKVDQR